MWYLSLCILESSRNISETTPSILIRVWICNSHNTNQISTVNIFFIEHEAVAHIKGLPQLGALKQILIKSHLLEDTQLSCAHAAQQYDLN